MMYLLAILLPSLAVLLCGRGLVALLLFLAQCTVIGWIPAAIVAVLIVAEKKADQRAAKYARSR